MWLSTAPTGVSVSSPSSNYSSNVATIRQWNEDWTYTFWNTNSFVQFLSSNDSLINYRNTWSLLTNDYTRYLFAMYCILYAEGGLYLRLDKVCLQSLNDLVGTKNALIVYDRNAGVDLSQLGFAAGSPILAKILNQFVYNQAITGNNSIRFGSHMVYNVLEANPSLFNSTNDATPVSTLSLYLAVSKPENHHHHKIPCKDETETTYIVIGSILLVSLIGSVAYFAWSNRRSKQTK